MKPIATLLLLCFLQHSAAISQKTNPRVNPDKYRINLPDYWGNGNKVWKILPEKLPLICDELKDKDLCGDNCNPKYTVDFYMTEPALIGYTKTKKQEYASTYTRGLVNVMPGKAIATSPGIASTERDPRMSIASNADIKENFDIYGEYTFQCFLLLRDDTGRVITRMILVDTNEVWLSKIEDTRVLREIGDHPDTFYDNNKDKFLPGKFDLFAIVDQKLLSL